MATKPYLLKLPDDLHRDLKALAISEGKTMVALMVEALRRFALGKRRRVADGGDPIRAVLGRELTDEEKAMVRPDPEQEEVDEWLAEDARFSRENADLIAECWREIAARKDRKGRK